jgi:hypothetical protein
MRYTRPASFFQNATEDQCVADIDRMTCDAPAYAPYGEYVRFSPDFANPGYGPMYRSAMVLHECVHYVDHISPDKAYEWEIGKWGYSLDAGCHDLAGLVAPAHRPLPGPWLACRWAGQLSASVQRDRPAKPVQARQPASSEYPNIGKYSALTPRDAIHNPSSYAAFGQNATPPFIDQRYGANRESD